MKNILTIIILLFACCIFAQTEIFSPVEYKVFQRETKSQGKILVSGKTDQVKVTVKITGKDFLGKSVNTSKTLKVGKLGEFSDLIKVPAGGWYTVSVNEIKVENVGVGEIFVTAGQSNSTCAGEFRTQQESGFVVNTDGVNWRLCNDPQIGMSNYDDGGSIYPSLGDILYKEFNVPIAFAPTGHGATVLEQWQPNYPPVKWSVEKRMVTVNYEGNPLYAKTMNRVSQLGYKGFRCMLWHQGEGDRGCTPEYYFEGLSNIIKQSRIDAGWNIPWFVAKASYSPGGGLDENVRAGQQRVIDEGFAYLGADSDTLLEEYRDTGGKGIHFSPKGLKVHAALWAEKLIPYIYSIIN